MTCKMHDWDTCGCGCARSRLGIIDQRGNLLTPSRASSAPSWGVDFQVPDAVLRADREAELRARAPGIGATVKLGRAITPAEQAGSFLGGGVRDFLVGAGLVAPAGAPSSPSWPSLGVVVAGGALLLLLLSRR